MCEISKMQFGQPRTRTQREEKPCRAQRPVAQIKCRFRLFASREQQPAQISHPHWYQIREITKQNEENICEPRTHHTTRIDDGIARFAVRPAWILRIVSAKRSQQVQGRSAKNDQRTLAQAANHMRCEGSAVFLLTF